MFWVLFCGYWVIGLVLAGVRLRRPPAERARADAALIVLLWPMYAPLSLTPPPTPPPDLDTRVDRLAEQAREIAAVLATPDFDRTALLARIAAHETLGQRLAAEAVRGTLANVDRLRALQQRHADELAAVEALRQQLRTQAEVIRISGGRPADLQGLVEILEAKVMGLEAVLDEPLLSGLEGESQRWGASTHQPAQTSQTGHSGSGRQTSPALQRLPSAQS